MTRPALHLSVAAFALGAASCVVVAPAQAQGTQEQQDACAPDAFKLCQNTIPDIPKTEACMRAHYAQLSPRCQHAFNDVTGGSSQRPPSDEASAPAAPPPSVAQAPRDDDDDMGIAAFPLDPTTGMDGTDDQRANEPLSHRGETTQNYEPYGSAAGPTGSYADQIRNECREGLIDPFTCRNTLAILRGSE